MLRRSLIKMLVLVMLVPSFNLVAGKRQAVATCARAVRNEYLLSTSLFLIPFVTMAITFMLKNSKKPKGENRLFSLDDLTRYGIPILTKLPEGVKDSDISLQQSTLRAAEMMAFFYMVKTLTMVMFPFALWLAYSKEDVGDELSCFMSETKNLLWDLPTTSGLIADKDESRNLVMAELRALFPHGIKLFPQKDSPALGTTDDDPANQALVLY